MKAIKRLVALGLAATMVFSVTACRGGSGGSSDGNGGEKTVEASSDGVYECNLTAASTSGSIYQWAVALSTIVNAHSDTVKINPVTTGGGAENVNLLTSGDCELALASAAIIQSAIDGTNGMQKNENIQLVYGMNPYYMVFITGGNTPYQSLEDLKGKNVSVFAESVGIAQWQLLREGLGIEPKEYFNALTLGISEATDGISAGTCDAVLTSSSKTQTAIVEMGAGPTGVDYIGFTDDEISKITSALPIYKEVEYQDYDLDKTVNAVMAYNYLVCNKNLPEEVSYEIARCIDEYHDEFVAAYAVAADSTAENTIEYAFADLASGTDKYFTEKGYK